MCSICHRLRDNHILSIETVTIRIFEVGQGHELQRRRMSLDGFSMAYTMVKNADKSQTVFM